jgi:oxygen-independent coproporphyrinogen-3 oxidase
MAHSAPLVNESEPKTNFFLFPPMQSVSPNASSVEELLAMDQVDDDRDYVLFVALPYCRVRCHSCHCYKHILPGHANEANILDSYVDALTTQIARYGATTRLSAKRCAAIYFGGGTASLLRPRHLDRLLTEMAKFHRLHDGLEITLEGSPLEFNAQYLAEVRRLGVTRISIGFQSRFDRLLEVLNSPHRAVTGLNAIEAAMGGGFDQVNVDLLYNIPRQTRGEWEEDVGSLIDRGVGSISIGDYMIFPQSPAEKLILQGKNPNQLPQAEVYDWFEWAVDQLTSNGYFEHVRGIFPKVGKEHDYVRVSCIDNSDIIGIGAGSYTFLSGYQLRNVMNVDAYTQRMAVGDYLAFDSISRKSSVRDLKARYIMHNFFASQIRFDRYAARFGTGILEDFPVELRSLARRNLVEIGADQVRLTREGRKLRKHVYHDFYTAN